jgi:hypothetical protein
MILVLMVCDLTRHVSAAACAGMRRTDSAPPGHGSAFTIRCRACCRDLHSNMISSIGSGAWTGLSSLTTMCVPWLRRVAGSMRKFVRRERRCALRRPRLVLQSPHVRLFMLLTPLAHCACLLALLSAVSLRCPRETTLGS